MPRVLGIDTSLTATGLCRIDINENDDGPVMKYSFEACCATVGAPKPTADKSKRAMVRRVNKLIEQIEGALHDPGQCCCTVQSGGAIYNSECPMHAVTAQLTGKPDLIAIEGLAYGAKGDSAWVLPWVFGRTIELAERYDVPLIVVGTAARAKYATGKGNAGKDEVMLAAVNLWPEASAKNNNESDALVVGAVGCHWLGFPITSVTQYRGDVLTKVTS